MKKFAFNPYLPSYEYIPDGEPRVFGERLYVFGSHDKFGGNDFCLNDYVAWSAPIDDLSDWRFEGVIYRKEQDPRSGEKLPLFAPDVIRGSDGRYYLYYSVKDSSVISVAVSNAPAGKYEYYGDVKTPEGRVYGTRPDDHYEFDPAILNDGGRYYLYSGFGFTAKAAGHRCVGVFVRELKADMLTSKGEPKILIPRKKFSFFRNGFFEGASIRKIGSLYFLVYPCSNMSGLVYCTSDRPDGGFRYRGRIHSTSDIGINGHRFLSAAYPIGNNHGGIAEVNGKYYIFDHRMTNNTMFSRQGVAEEIQISDDGTIGQVECTSCGLNGGPLPAKGEYPAYIACNLMSRRVLGMRVPFRGAYITQDGEDRECGPDQYISQIENGTVVGFKYFRFDGTESRLCVQVRGFAQGTLLVYDRERKGALLTKIDLHPDQSEWAEFSAPLCKTKGKRALFFKFRGKGKFDMNSFSVR